MLAKNIPEIRHCFLADSKNSSFRESILKSKFKYDFQMAYTEYGRYLYIYERDIDKSSTDLIIEGSGFIHRVQLKSVLENAPDLESLERYNSPTASWTVSSDFIQPEIAWLDLLSENNKFDVYFEVIEPDGPPLGYGGSIILQRIHYFPDDSVEVRYSVFNILLLYLAASNKYKTNFYGEADSDNVKLDVKKFFKEILESRDKNITIKRSWFIDLYGEHIRYIGAMGIPIPEAPFGLWFYLQQINKGNCRESYHRVQCIFSNQNVLDP